VGQPVELPLPGGSRTPARGRAPVPVTAVHPYIAQGRVAMHPVPPVAAQATDGGADGDGRRYLPPLLLLLAGPAVLALIVLDAPAWLRAAPVLCYVCTAPGYAVVRLLRLSDLLMTALLGVGVSLAVGLIVAQLMIYADLWSPLLGLSTLVVLASVATAAELLPGAWRVQAKAGVP
jgi:hypothetical protein